MRTMMAHVIEDGYVDYYECSECGWAYPFPRFVGKSDLGLMNEQMAKRDFDSHLCNKHPRKPVTRASRIKLF
jgi:hypothetical protein